MITKEVDSKGNIWYYNEKHELHQDDDLPAAILKSGTVYYYKNGRYHRLAGPARIYSCGIFFYCIHGELLTKEKFDRHPLVREYRLKKVVEGLLNG